MKASDLMIGDWVIFHDSGYASDNTIWKEDRICQIDSIDGDVRVKWTEEDGTKEDWPHVSITDLSPIPLAGKMLEKNGFTDGEYRHYCGFVWKLKLEGFRETGFTIFGDGGTLWGEKIKPKYPHSVGDKFHVPNIKYVHELQHALKLCGIEKEIVL